MENRASSPGSLREEGNAYFQRGKYALAIEAYTKAIDAILADSFNSHPSDVHKLFSNRSAAYLQEKMPHEALRDAQSCVELQKDWPKGYGRLGDAFFVLKEYGKAVVAYKKGLDIDASNDALRESLQRARIQALNEMVMEGEEGDKKAEEEYERAAQSLQNSQIRDRNSIGDITTDGITRISHKLSLNLLVNRVLCYTLEELAKVPALRPAIGFFILAVICLLNTHYYKIICLCAMVGITVVIQTPTKIQRVLKEQYYASMDKLRSALFVPCIAYCIPILMSLYGQIKFFWFISQHDVLAKCVFLVGVTFGGYGYLQQMQSSQQIQSSQQTQQSQQNQTQTTNVLLPPSQPRKAWWDNEKYIKLACQVVVLLYWVVWLQNSHDVFRMTAPAAMNVAGILASHIPAAMVQESIQSALLRSIKDVTDDISTEISSDMWLVLGLGQWAVEYWNEPTDFSLADLGHMLRSSFDTMNSTISSSFRNELKTLRSQFTDLHWEHDLFVLVKYVRKTVDELPPPDSLAYTVLILKRCQSLVVLLVLWGVKGTFVYALVPFVFVEKKEILDALQLILRHIEEQHMDENHHNNAQSSSDEGNGDVCTPKFADSIDLVLSRSKLLPVWSNTKAAVSCLEYGCSIAKTAKAGSKAVEMAMKVVELASTVMNLRAEGCSMQHASKFGNSVVDLAETWKQNRTVLTEASTESLSGIWEYAVHRWRRRDNGTTNSVE